MCTGYQTKPLVSRSQEVTTRWGGEEQWKKAERQLEQLTQQVDKNRPARQRRHLMSPLVATRAIKWQCRKKLAVFLCCSDPSPVFPTPCFLMLQWSQSCFLFSVVAVIPFLCSQSQPIVFWCCRDPSPVFSFLLLQWSQSCVPNPLFSDVAVIPVLFSVFYLLLQWSQSCVPNPPVFCCCSDPSLVPLAGPVRDNFTEWATMEMAEIQVSYLSLQC